MTIDLPELPFYDQTGPLPIAHRGGDLAGEDKENSLAAFDSAYQAGLRYGETDTVATADGVALAIHGSRNKHQMAATGLPVRSALEQMTYEDVQKHVRVGGEQVPQLEELLVSFPGMRFFIDPKTTQSVKPLGELINKLRIHDRVSVGAFSFNRTQAVANMVSEQARVCTTIGALGGLALFGRHISFPQAKDYVRRSGASQYAMPFRYMNTHRVDKAHELGLRVILWTPNSKADIRHSFSMGADGVMSDRTHLVKQLAEAHRPR